MITPITDEQAVIAIFPRAGLAVGDAERNDLRGARLARHLDIVERQPRASRRAGSVYDIAHRLPDVADFLRAEIEMLKLGLVALELQPRHDLVPGRHARAHHRQLERVGQVIALADRGIDRVIGLPCAVVTPLLPFG